MSKFFRKEHIMKKTSLILLIMVLAVSISFSILGCEYETGSAEPGVFDRSEIQLQEGKTAQTGDMKWELLEAEDLGTQIESDAGAILKPTRGKFIFVSFAVENTGTDIKTLLDSKVIDDKGRIYSICNEAYGYYTSTYSACTLAPIVPDSGVQRFSATFDVDPDSRDLVLEVTDLEIPPEEKAYIDLGL
jgi:hypothetical protein